MLPCGPPVSDLSSVRVCYCSVRVDRGPRVSDPGLFTRMFKTQLAGQKPGKSACAKMSRRVMFFMPPPDP